jgi:hypothetical protein
MLTGKAGTKCLSSWAGRYVLTVVYVEDKAGRAGNENFDRTRHVATLSFVQSDGQPWPAP